jgi:hypothetical protein
MTMNDIDKDFEDFFEHYLICALWASSDTDAIGRYFNFDDLFTTKDFEEESLKYLRSTAYKFYRDNKHMFKYKQHTFNDGTYTDYMLAGHDFWLTHNGHGAGFWDGDVENEEHAKILSDNARDMGEISLCATDGLDKVFINF